MKFHLLIIILLLTHTNLLAQVWVGGVDISKDDNVKVVEVFVAEKLTSKSVRVFVDFGQKTNFKVDHLNNDDKVQLLVDPETKKEMVFVSTGAVLNFMERNNWEHYETAIPQERSAEGIYLYFRKRQ